MDEKDQKTIGVMYRFGGSFVKALAECAIRADPVNLRILKMSFSKYFKEYENWHVQDNQDKINNDT